MEVSLEIASVSVSKSVHFFHIQPRKGRPSTFVKKINPLSILAEWIDLGYLLSHNFSTFTSYVVSTCMAPRVGTKHGFHVMGSNLIYYTKARDGFINIKILFEEKVSILIGA